MYSSLLLPELRLLIESNDVPGMREFCEVLHPAVTAEVLSNLEVTDAWKVLATCEIERRVEIFEFMELPQQAEMAEGLDRKKLSRLIEEMAADDRVDLLRKMKPDRVEKLLPLIAQAERSDIRKLLSCREGSAGAMMTTDYAALPETITVREAFDRLRKQAPDRETIYYIYITDDERHLDGMISLRELILADPDKKLKDVMNTGILTVRMDDDQEVVAQALAKYDFLAIPVVDNQNHIVGIITHDDVLDVLQEEATEDAYRLGAVEPLEESYLEAPLPTIAWKRGVWLFFLAVMALVTARVLQGFGSMSEQHVWMVLFLPLVLASGGNAGSQSATLIIRTLALGELEPQGKYRMVRREVMIGLMLGFTLSVLAFVAGWLWFGLAIHPSLVVAGTVLIVVMIGTFWGAVLPLVFKHLGMDPALMSTPLIAALSDIVGVAIYYNVAFLLLKVVEKQ